MKNKTTYTIRDSQGLTHEVQGEPSSLTIGEALQQFASGRKGGEEWTPTKVVVRIGSREYRQSDFDRSFQDLGVEPGSTIEVMGV